jgi:hypothetical protein
LGSLGGLGSGQALPVHGSLGGLGGSTTSGPDCWLQAAKTINAKQIKKKRFITSSPYRETQNRLSQGSQKPG